MSERERGGVSEREREVSERERDQTGVRAGDIERMGDMGGWGGGWERVREGGRERGGREKERERVKKKRRESE